MVHVLDRRAIRNRLRATTLALVAVLLAAGTTDGAPAPGQPPDIRVEGRHLVDDEGRRVVLRGVNMSGTEFVCIQGGEPSRRGWGIYGGQPLADASTAAGIRSWGANAVRVPLNEDCWLGINGTEGAYGGQPYREAVRRVTDTARDAGLYVILDLHWSAPSSWAAYGQNAMADADHSLDFWRSVASEYRDDGHVLFDLFNEPFFYYITDGTPEWTCWQQGCEMHTVLTHGQVDENGDPTPFEVRDAWRTAGMQQMLDAVRSTGARQPVIVKGTDWGNDLTGWLEHRPHDPLGQIVAGWHSYPLQPCGVQTCWDEVIAPIAEEVPVVVSETGDHTWTEPDYMPELLPWADAHGLSYLPWTWNVWEHESNVLITTWDGEPTPGQGRFYRDHLSGVQQAPAGSGRPTLLLPR